MTIHGVIEGRIFTLTQRRVEVSNIEDFTAVKTITSRHSCRGMHNTRHQAESLVDIRDIPVGYCDSADRVVVHKCLTSAYQPVNRKDDISVNHSDQPATCRSYSCVPGVTAATVLVKLNEPYTTVLHCKITDYPGGTVLRAIIHND